MHCTLSIRQRLGHFCKRLAAAMYDSVLLLGLLFAGSFVALIFTSGAAVHPHNPWYNAYLWCLGWLFFSGFWCHGGQTLGLRAWRLQVVDVHGQPLSWPRATLRYALALPCWLSVVGLLWAVFDPHCASLHERLSGTRLQRLDG